MVRGWHLPLRSVSDLLWPDKDGFDFVEPQAAGLEVKLPVMPSRVPTLKSISPKKSFAMMSVTWVMVPSAAVNRPTEMPARVAVIGTPASIMAKQPPQTDAMEDEPFDSVMSETTRMVYGKSSGSGRMAKSERSARAPWPTSRRPGPDSTGFAYTEVGVVVQVELLGEFRQQTVDDLLITTGTQGAKTKDWSARWNKAEPWVGTLVRMCRADFLGRATVGTGARVVDQLLGDLLLEGPERFLGHASVFSACFTSA